MGFLAGTTTIRQASHANSLIENGHCCTEKAGYRVRKSLEAEELMMK